MPSYIHIHHTLSSFHQHLHSPHHNTFSDVYFITLHSVHSMPLSTQPLPDDLTLSPFSPLWHLWLGLEHRMSSTPSNQDQSSTEQNLGNSNKWTKMNKASLRSEPQERSWDDQRNNNSNPPTFTLALAGLLSVGLVVKAVTASRRAKIASHEAEAWRRVALRMLDRGEGKLTHEEADQVRLARWVKRGCPPKAPAILEQQHPKQKHHHHRRNNKEPRNFFNPRSVCEKNEKVKQNRRADDKVVYFSDWLEEQSQKKNDSENDFHSHCKPFHANIFSEPEWSKTQTIAEPIRKTSTSAKMTQSSLYAPVHPHEDWDWTPADWPGKVQTSWRRSRLPPWTIGFSSAPKVPTCSSSTSTDAASEKVHQGSFEALAKDKVSPAPRRGIEAAIKAHQSGTSLEEELLLQRDDIWPDAPVHGKGQDAEASFVVAKTQIQKPENGIEAAIKAHQKCTSTEELLFQAGVWPDAFPYPEQSSFDGGESMFIADEVIKEVFEQKQKRLQSEKKLAERESLKLRQNEQSQENVRKVDRKEDEKISATTSASPSSSDVSTMQIEGERVKALEFQVWALLQRIDDLERFGQRASRRF